VSLMYLMWDGGEVGESDVLDVMRVALLRIVTREHFTYIGLFT